MYFTIEIGLGVGFAFLGLIIICISFEDIINWIISNQILLDKALTNSEKSYLQFFCLRTAVGLAFFICSITYLKWVGISMKMPLYIFLVFWFHILLKFFRAVNTEKK
jgi:hypothetical protein